MVKMHLVEQFIRMPFILCTNILIWHYPFQNLKGFKVENRRKMEFFRKVLGRNFLLSANYLVCCRRYQNPVEFSEIITVILVSFIRFIFHYYEYTEKRIRDSVVLIYEKPHNGTRKSNWILFP